MKIAFNSSTVEALITPPNNKDITFDLRGHNIFARGVKFCGTDTWRPVVDNLTSDSTTSSLSANQGRILKALIDGKSDSDHNHDNRYVKKAGDTMQGNLAFASGKQTRWTAYGTSYITNGNADIGTSLGGDLANLVISSWNGVSFTTSCSGQTYTNKTAVGINCRTGIVYAANFVGALQGNASSATNADKVDGYHASTIYNAPSFTVKNGNTSNTYILLATITISGTSLSCAEFTTLFQNRECLDNSSFILSGAIRRNSTTNVSATLSYITLHNKTPRNIYLRSNDGVTFMVYIQSAASAWTTYYRAIPIVDSGNIIYSNTGTTSPISGSVLNITAIKGGNVIYANSAGSASSATKVIVNQHTANDTNYPLVWSNQFNTNTVTENQLYKSWSDLYYNPKNKRLTVGGSVVASSFVKSGGTSQQLLRADGGIATFNWSGQSGQPTWLWGGNNQHSYYVYNPSNFRVAYASSAGNADTLDGYHANGLLTALSNTNNGISVTVGGTTKSVSNISVNYASSAGSVAWSNVSGKPTIPNPTDYYWANVKISTSSSTTTSPTVSNLTATSYIRMGNMYLQNTNEINSTSGIHLNYQNSGNVSLCVGGGNVGIGTTTPQTALDIRSNEIAPLSVNGAIKLATNPNGTYYYQPICVAIGKIKTTLTEYETYCNANITFESGHLNHIYYVKIVFNDITAHSNEIEDYILFISTKNNNVPYLSTYQNKLELTIDNNNNNGAPFINVSFIIYKCKEGLTKHTTNIIYG